MLNKEKFKEEIFEIACSGYNIAVSKKDGEIKKCSKDLDCKYCLFYYGEADCHMARKNWGNSEYVPVQQIDWSKVPVDTKILVSYDGRSWFARHFAKFENGEVCAWILGQTSFTTKKTPYYTAWKYAKLYEEALTGEGSEKENGVAVTCEDKKNNSVKEDDKRIFEFTGKTTYDLNGDYVFMTKDREYYDVPDAIERLLPEETHEEDEFKITIEKL